MPGAPSLTRSLEKVVNGSPYLPHDTEDGKRIRLMQYKRKKLTLLTDEFVDATIQTQRACVGKDTLFC